MVIPLRFNIPLAILVEFHWPNLCKANMMMLRKKKEKPSQCNVLLTDQSQFKVDFGSRELLIQKTCV